MVTTLTTTAGEDARIAPAFGDLLGLSGNANAAQCKAHLADYIRQVVMIYEHKQAALTANPTPVSPT